MIEKIIAAMAICFVVAIGATAMAVTHHYSVKICAQNGMDYSFWRGDQYVAR